MPPDAIVKVIDVTSNGPLLLMACLENCSQIISGFNIPKKGFYCGIFGVITFAGRGNYDAIVTLLIAAEK
ncbi:hypothetical protein [Brucella pituitosa]|uniref:hypothetical protein n=1 Tax=Brucella pituitosa TaxID=571256 RepID=UPI000C26E3EA|nr:hypothetical protein [Brucella pituitosa]PJO48261.1 hypothetical protein CWE02_00010 [Brucella pituitosa]